MDEEPEVTTEEQDEDLDQDEGDDEPEEEAAAVSHNGHQSAAPVEFTATVKGTALPPAHDKPIVLQLAIPRSSGLRAVFEIAELGMAELLVTLKRRQPLFGESGTSMQPGVTGFLDDDGHALTAGEVAERKGHSPDELDEVMDSLGEATYDGGFLDPRRDADLEPEAEPA